MFPIWHFDQIEVDTMIISATTSVNHTSSDTNGMRCAAGGGAATTTRERGMRVRAYRTKSHRVKLCQSPQRVHLEMNPRHRHTQTQTISEMTYRCTTYCIQLV